MFSVEDVRSICRLFPPVKSGSANLKGLPTLLPSPSNGHFTISERALQEFERTISCATERSSLTSLSRRLDVTAAALLQFVQFCPHLALLNNDKSAVLSKSERDALWRELRDVASDQVISEAEYSQEHDICIESIGNLISVDFDGKIPSKDLTRSANEPYITSVELRRTLEQHLQATLSDAKEKARSVSFRSQDVPGLPPLPFVSKLVKDILERKNENATWRIEETDKGIECIPHAFIAQKRDATIEALRTGDMPFIDLPSFAREYHELHPTVDHVRDHLSSSENSADVIVQGDVAISQAYLNILKDKCIEILQNTGEVDLKEAVSSVYSKEYTYVFQTLLDLIYGNNESPSDEYLDSPISMGNHLVTPEQLDKIRVSLSDMVIVQAQQHWEDLREKPDAEPKFSLSAIVEANITKNNAVLRTLAEQDGGKDLERQYVAELSRLEAQNEIEFRTFWSERVFSRYLVYEHGLDGVGDAKLKDQLSELLATYAFKELIPESLAKAKTLGLMRSRRTRKNVLRLESILKATKKDISSVSASIKKFSSKQGIERADDAKIIEMKQGMIEEIVRKMQKQSDGPLLFLTLVIVLLARHKNGFIYATGKFAPKLMKQLRMSLDAEAGERLEQWKDAAKTGTLTKEDKEKMKVMAAG